ncbi:MAG TPA: ABC transporter transmembrane domain-containing protein, partial [Dermatophilaceae bacterium]|nr:ABC transporter transmembrane domain-containing protein [Dermatophilaceae bacterium]
MSMQSGWGMVRALSRDSSVAQRKLAPGTARRVVGYASPYRRQIIAFLVLVVIDAALVVAPPLLLGQIIDRGVTPGNSGVVVRLSLLVAALAVLDGVMTLMQRWYSSRIGEGLIFDLRTQVFAHVLRQPIAFFTRAQTGSLVSRLDGDVVGAQQAITSTLSGVLSNLLSLVVILIALFYLSWQVTV